MPLGSVDRDRRLDKMADYVPLEGEALSRHLGFGDGLRVAIGREPLDLERPVCVKFPDAYFEGMESGKSSGTNFVAGGSKPIAEEKSLLGRVLSLFGRGA